MKKSIPGFTLSAAEIDRDVGGEFVTNGGYSGGTSREPVQCAYCSDNAGE